MKASIDLLTAAAAREYELSAEALTDGNEEESAERLSKANGFANAAKVLENVGRVCDIAQAHIARALEEVSHNGHNDRIKAIWTTSDRCRANKPSR